MDILVAPKIQIQVFSKYIGQQVWLQDMESYNEESIGILSGVKENAVLLKIRDEEQWIDLENESPRFKIRLLLKPLSCLTEAIKHTANSLPVTVFITQYYVQMGFDMPVFISPGHPLNCKYAAELGLADYRLSGDILPLNKEIQMS